MLVDHAYVVIATDVAIELVVPLLLEMRETLVPVVVQKRKINDESGLRIWQERKLSPPRAEGYIRRAALNKAEQQDVGR